MTEPAVAKSRRIMDRPMETASSSSTLILFCLKQRRPLRRKGTACHSTRAILKGVGRNRVLTSFSAALPTSFSSNWRLSIRLLCAGRDTLCSACFQENCRTACKTVSLAPV